MARRRRAAPLFSRVTAVAAVLLTLVLEGAAVLPYGPPTGVGPPADETAGPLLAPAIASDELNWTNMEPSPSPSARANLPMVYDTSSDRAIVWGGFTGGFSGTDETWAYDFETNTWTNLAPGKRPPARWTHQMAFDSQSDRAIMFGGCRLEPQYECFNDTWAYDFENNTWTNMAPTTAPSVRRNQGMAYDSRTDRVILFGGLSAEGYSNDTWAYDFETNTWTDLQPVIRPPGRRSPGTTYDRDADRVLVFGGLDSSQTSLSDTWAYDLGANAWTNLTPNSGPASRYHPTLAYEVVSHRSILFGGRASNDGLYSDTWAYDFASNTWSLLNPWSRPPARFLSSMTYDVRSGRIVLFGGDGDALFGDTWTLPDGLLAPSAPQGLRADPGNGQVALAWQPPVESGSSTVSGYRMYRSTEPGNYILVAAMGVALSYTDGNVTNGVSYGYRVTALNSVGEGPPSNEVAATPDGVLPVTTATLSGVPGRNDWFTSSSVGVTLAARDDGSGVASIAYRLDGSGWQAYASAFAVVGDGVHMLQYSATDRAGNAEAVVSRPISIDTAAPTTTVHLQGTSEGGYWYTSRVEVLFAAVDATSGVASTSYRLDGGAWRTYVAALRVGEGSHVLDYLSTDVAGLSEAPQSVSFAVDATAPTTAVALVGASGSADWFVGPVVVTLVASDAASGVASISYRVDGGIWQTYIAPFFIGEGQHLLEYRAIDVAGLLGPTLSRSVNVDLTAPSLSGLAPRGVVPVRTFTISWQASDSGSGIERFEVSVDGGTFWSVGKGMGAAVSLADGDHRVVVRAYDVAGNVAEQAVDLKVDTNPFSLSGPYGGAPTYATLAILGIGALVAAIVLRRRRKRESGP